METVCSISEVSDDKNENGANITDSTNKNSQEPVNLDLNETGSNEDRPDPPLQNQQLDENQTKLQEDQVLSPLKRCISSETLSDEAKKSKVEPDDEKQKQDDSDEPSDADDVEDDGSSDEDSLPEQPRRSLRNRNPQHKAEFSHRADRDWGAGDRGECPWGRACQKRDPRHRAYDHPPRTRPPRLRLPQPHKRRQIVRRNGNIYYINAHTVYFCDGQFSVEDSDEDSGEKKKEGSPDEEDSDSTDDEWQPSTKDLIESQSQDDDLPDVLTSDLSEE